MVGHEAPEIRLAEVIGVLEQLYPSNTAQSWDQVGLVTGDPDQPVRRILVALDPTLAVIEEAGELGADLLLTHHPLLLRGVHSVATTGAKGMAVTRLVRSQIALYVTHTNADVAERGVCAALAAACGLSKTEPIAVEEGQPLGRVGELPAPIPLRQFAYQLAAALPPTPVGLRVAGPPEALVQRIAVAGGAGDGFFDAARDCGADVYVTGDLRHHPALEAREEGAPYLIDAGHYGSEAVWIPYAVADLRERLGSRVEVSASRLCTDPWTFVIAGESGAG